MLKYSRIGTRHAKTMANVAEKMSVVKMVEAEKMSMVKMVEAEKMSMVKMVEAKDMRSF